MQDRDFFTEMATATTGCDDPATEAYLRVLMVEPQYAAVNAHWMAADENLREALSPHLGFTPPSGRLERAPVPPKVLDAYMAFMERVGDLLGDCFSD